MKKNFRLVATRVLVIIVGAFLVVISCSFRESITSQDGRANRVDNQMTHPESDPCLFMKFTSENAGDPTLRERQEREMYGYKTDIPLRDALTIFNTERKCFPGTYDPLTEEEVIAAIAAGADYDSEDVFADHRSELAMIAQKMIMPKGSLFVSEGDATYNDRFLRGEIFIKGQRIYLFLGLDKNPRYSMPLKSGQIFLVRKRFVKTGTKE